MRIKLGDVCDRDSSSLRQKDIVPESGGFPIYGASGLISHVDFYHQEKPYVAVVKDGAGVGRTMLLPAFSSVIGTLQYLVPKQNVLPEYLEYVVRYMRLEKYSTGATIPHIYFKDYQREEFRLSSLQEQEKIVVKLGSLERVIEKRKRQLYRLDELIKARFVEMFGNQKELVPLSYYVESLTSGKSLAGDEECSYKVLNTSSVSYDYFDSSQVKNLPLNYLPREEHLVNEGDVIISRMNTEELVGACAYVWTISKSTFLPDRLWRAEIRNNINPIFLWQLLIQPSTKRQVRRVASGTSGSMKNISKSSYLGIKVKKVPSRIQNQFADFVTQVDKSKVVLHFALKAFNPGPLGYLVSNRTFRRII